ncbi:hypothetical protein Tco_1215097 [Tanacetum coccineum]
MDRESRNGFLISSGRDAATVLNILYHRESRNGFLISSGRDAATVLNILVSFDGCDCGSNGSFVIRRQYKYLKYKTILEVTTGLAVFFQVFIGFAATELATTELAVQVFTGFAATELAVQVFTGFAATELAATELAVQGFTEFAATELPVLEFTEFATLQGFT